ncbi:AsmA family protein [Pararhizobium mangrovi]|uniref:AsmA family protein n=1 Tax=Pararhizobium mangrovi TaxID=2590452 RepID=A0A506U5A7_9HYPH|nr:AsmA family protein [Pararhizobium mangrovi]TPW29543.1 AsmA family protein [Pararhizobium mangrovi]
MHKLARVFLILGGVIVVLLFAALVGPYFVDWTNYRDSFEREASRILGQKVEVHGEAEARLLPFPSVTFHDVSVENRETGKTMMTISTFSMDAELAPFLRGEILIFDMRIKRPHATIRLASDGRVNWASRIERDLPARSIKLEHVEVSNGSIDFVDEQNHRTTNVTALQAQLSADRLAGPWHMTGTGAVAGRSGAFSLTTGSLDSDGSIRLRTRILPDAEPISLEADGTASFQDGKPQYGGQFTLQILDLANVSGTQNVDADNDDSDKAVARATGSFALNNERLQVDSYRLEVGADDDPYVVTGMATIDTGKDPTFQLQANGEQVDIDKLRDPDAQPSKTDRRRPPPTPSQRLAILHRVADLIPIPPMPGKASIHLPAVVAGDTMVRDVAVEARPNGKSWTIDNFRGTFPGRTEVEAKGQLNLDTDFGFDGHLLVAARQPSGLARWLTGKVDPQIRLLDAAGLSADVELSAKAQHFDNLELAVGSSTIHGSFARLPGNANGPRLTMNLDGDTIDLDAVRALEGLVTGKHDGLGLQASSVEAKLSADRFEAFGTQARGVDAALAYDDGTLKIDHLTIDALAGAALSAKGHISDITTSPTGHVEASLNADDPKPILALADRLVGGNPILSRIEKSAGAFGNADLSLTADADDDGLTAKLDGTAGKSDVTVSLRRDSVLGAPAAVPMTFDAEASNASVNHLIRQLGFEPLPVEAPGPGKAAVHYAGTFDDKANVTVTLSGGDSTMLAKGRLGPADKGQGVAGTLDLSVTSDDLTPYFIMSAVALPQTASAIPAELHAGVAITPSSLALTDIGGSLSNDAVRGKLTVQRKDRPVVDGKLSLDSASAPWLAAFVLGSDAVSSDGKDWSKQDFTSAQDPGFDADIALTADRVDLGGTTPARDFSGTVALKGGALTVSKGQAHWHGGDLSGDIKLSDASGAGLLTSRISLESADLATIFPGKDEPVTGTATLTASLEGSGKNPRALVDALTGSGTLAVKDLAIGGLHTDGFTKILQGADAEGFAISEKSVRAIAERAIDGGRWQAGDASAPFTVTGGRLDASNIALAGEHAKLMGNADIDLARQTLDADFVLAFRPQEDTLAGGTPAVAIHYTGPIDAPKRTLDATELSNYLSLRAYEIQRRKVELLQAGVLEKQRLRREIALLDAEASEREAIRIRKERESEAARGAAEAAERPEPSSGETPNRDQGTDAPLDIGPLGTSEGKGFELKQPSFGALPSMGEREQSDTPPQAN